MEELPVLSTSTARDAAISENFQHRSNELKIFESFQNLIPWLLRLTGYIPSSSQFLQARKPILNSQSTLATTALLLTSQVPTVDPV